MEALVNAIKQLGSKVTDQAHLGKLITDFTPGLLVVFTLLVTLDAFSSFEVLPYLNGERYDERADIALVNLRHASREVDNARANLAEAEKAAGAPDLKAIDIDELDERLKQMQAAKVPVAAEISLLRERRASERKAQAEAKFQRELQQQRLAPLRAELETRRTREREREKDLVDARQSAAHARTLAGNLEKLGEHAASLLTIAMLVGAVLAQVSGLVFYNGLFYRFMKSSHSERQTGREQRERRESDDGSPALAKTPEHAKGTEATSGVWEILYGTGRPKYGDNELTHEGEAFYRGLLHDVRRDVAPRPQAAAAEASGASHATELAGNEDLTGYFRYLEVAMNSIIPCGLFALAMLAIATRNLHRDLTAPGSNGIWWLAIALEVLVALPAGAYVLQQRTLAARTDKLTTWLRAHPLTPWLVALGLSGFCLIFALRGVAAGTWSVLALAGACVLVSVALYYNARALYVGYFVKRAEAMLLVYHKLREAKQSPRPERASELKGAHPPAHAIPEAAE